MKKIIAAVLLILSIFSCGADADADADLKVKLENGLYAEIKTSKGTILVRLEFGKVPMTVINFAGLAEGKITNTFRTNKPYFDGLTFHRVVDNFVIQGGDPAGNGSGNPGYRFGDEFHPDLKHDAEGVLSMANSGPGTNGSQFFITLSATSAAHLDNKHSVFGYVIEGMDIVKQIKQGDKIISIEIVRVGSDAEKFKTDQAAFEQAQKDAPKRAQELIRIRREAEQKKAETYILDAKKTASGIYYKVLQSTNGAPAKPGKTLKIHFIGALLDGTQFSVTYGRDPIEIQLQAQQMPPAWEEILPLMKTGEKWIIVVPPELAYGSEGYPGLIPPDSYIYYELELVEVL